MQNGKQILNNFGFLETKTALSEKRTRRWCSARPAFIFSGDRCACARRASAPAGTWWSSRTCSSSSGTWPPPHSCSTADEKSGPRLNWRAVNTGDLRSSAFKDICGSTFSRITKNIKYALCTKLNGRNNRAMEAAAFSQQQMWAYLAQKPLTTAHSH